MFFIENCGGTNSVLRTGKMVTLHPSQGGAEVSLGKPER
jgi:hypothetical protein